MEVGRTLFKAQGSAFYADGSANYYIEEGVVTSMVDDAGRQIVSTIGGRLYVPLDDRWRQTKAEAIRDARNAVSAYAIRMTEKAAEIEQAAVAAEGGAA